MVCVFLILSGAAVIGISGVPALFLSRDSNAGQRLTVSLLVSGCLAGLTGTFLSLAFSVPLSFIAPWAIPWGQFSISIDKLSAFFLVLVFTVPSLGAVFGLGYWKQSENPKNGHKLGLFYGLLVSAMGFVVIAHDAILFLIAWEVMALSAYFTLTTEDDKAEVRQSGWIYFVCTHMGTLTLFALFTIWRVETGSFSLTEATFVPTETAGILFLLTLIGFGFKAGFMPLHVWLPGAHANAPSHVSAIMSGVLLKMGVYGIIRMVSLLPVAEPWWGALLLAVSAVTALLGIVFAIGQRDFKRILAYSSIENIGIIGMGIGLALLGRSYERSDLVLLGMGSALFHIWNHGLFKGLLFMNSGAVIHATHTRDIEAMGALSKRMPVTAFLFLIGAISISALPPFNGFASEWLLYLGLFKTLDGASSESLAMAGFAAVGLAMVGALALATFVRMYGTVFLGASRSNATEHAHDPSLSMKIPMAILASLCVILGILPALVSPFLENAVRAWAPRMDIVFSAAFIDAQWYITMIGCVILAILAIFTIIRKGPEKKETIPKVLTWDCGYCKPTSRMQYTGTSFAQTVIKLFSFITLPKKNEEKAKAHFPEKTRFDMLVPDTFLDRLFLPFFAFIAKIIPKVYVFQQGQTHLYVLYIGIIALALFIFGGTGVIL